MVGPNFTTPSAPLADKWREVEDDGVDTTRQEYGEWWKIFNDPTLENLIEAAYAENLTLRMAGVRVLQARAQLGIAIGEIYPQQQMLQGALSYDRLPVSLPYKLSNPTYLSTFLGAQVGWEIDLWGKIRRGVESADDAFLGSVANYDDALVTLLGDVASTYVQIRVIERQIAIAHGNIEKQREALHIADVRFRGGVVSELDVFQAENVLGATEATVPALIIALEKARNALAVLLGQPPGSLAQLLAPGEIPLGPARVAVGIPAELLRRRPDIRRAELEAAAQCAQIGVAKADLLPAFSLIGNVGTFSTDAGTSRLSDLFTGKSLAWAVGPSVQWNVLNYGQITNNVRLQDARFQELLIDYQQAVLNAQKEVENGIAMFVQSRRQAADLQRSVEAARKALGIALNQYAQGITDFTTVLTAEQNLYTAQSNWAGAQGNVPLGLIATYRALGGGWQIRERQEFVPRAVREEMEERTNWGTVLSPELLEPKAPPLPGPEDTGPTIRAPEW